MMFLRGKLKNPLASPSSRRELNLKIPATRETDGVFTAPGLYYDTYGNRKSKSCSKYRIDLN